ncbi:hypothetical protein HPB50_024102 [Hyalomma asiaticum]|uniref:Uncharacterized protein n=1 Tax=Hyalomma asiaticum TaxID=266040 RepID=A0ACB7S1X3_HYAAI|nr:hypothetical protein HPB50_024102 [Hyalomma asiaticum]
MEQGNRKRQRRSEGRLPPYAEPSRPPSASPQPPNRGQRATPAEHKSFRSKERRRCPATASPRRPVPAQPTSVDQPPVRPIAELTGRSHRDVATWTSQEGVDPPVVYVSTRPWRRQMRARVGMAEARLFRPFQGRTVTDVDRRAQGACLPVPAGTRFCECGAVLIHPAHEHGALHRRRTRMEAQSPARSEEPRSNDATRVMLERAARDQGFANWLLQPLDAAMDKELESALKAFLKKGEVLVITKKVDPSIMGGMLVSIGDKFVDMSIATKVKTYTGILKQAV